MCCSLNDNILRSALASKLSYLQNCKKTVNHPLVKQLHSTTDACKIVDMRSGAHMYIYESGLNSKLVAFRGTHSIEHMIKYSNRNMSSFDIRGHKIKIHHHILNLFESLESVLTNMVFTDIQTNYTFCGHSAGGGLAHFAAAYYSDITNNNTNIKCHTFGCPMIGNDSFIKWHDVRVKESIDILHQNDIVNFLPYNLNYKPFTKQLIIQSYPKASNPILSHNMDTYLASIEVLMQSGHLRHI